MTNYNTYCGLDMGKKSSHFCIIDETRKILREGKISNRIRSLQGVFSKLPSMRIVIEASTKSFWMADQLESLGHEVVVVDPGRTKAIGASLIKHDKLDARVLATLNQADILAKVSRPTLQERLDRTPIVVRDGLVKSRVKMINTVRSLLDTEGIEVPSSASDGFTILLRRRMVLDIAPPKLATALAPLLDVIETLTDKINECDEMIIENTKSDPVIMRLMTAPGVGPIVASYFAMAVRDPSRFKNGRQVGAYLGLVPSLYASGKIMRRGRITKCGSSRVRWALSIAANAILRTKTQSQIRDWGQKLVLRLGRKKAVVAIARKLASVLWSMWKNETRFDPMYNMQ